MSNAISNLANEMKEEKEIDPFEEKRQEIKALLKEKDIEIEGLKIKRANSGRYFVEV